jgi:hypothetical protein
MIDNLITQELTYLPSTSGARSIKLLPEGKVQDIQIATWELIEKGVPTIVFRDKDNNFVSRLQWSATKFQGMDHNGWVELRVSRPDEIAKMLVANRDVRLHGKTSDAPRKDADRVNLRYSLVDKVGFRDPNKDTAVAIIACNRINYYKEVLEALAPQLEGYPVYVFLDKPEDPNQVDLQEKHEALTKFLVPSAKIIKRDVNFGCGLNIVDAREQLFTNLGYQKVFVFEDDLVVSPDYLEYCEKLWDWSRQFSNVGAVQGWSRCFSNLSEKRRKNKEVHVTFDNAWGYLMGKDCWDAIRPDMLDYVTFLSDRLYANRDNMRISRWNHKFKQLNFVPRGDNPFELDPLSKLMEASTLNNLPTGQDGTTYILMRHAGFVRVASTVNRAKYIGKTGIHSTSDLFLRSGLDRITLDYIKIPDEFKQRKATKNAKQVQSV